MGGLKLLLKLPQSDRCECGALDGMFKQPQDFFSADSTQINKTVVCV